MDTTELRDNYREQTGKCTMVSDDTREPHYTLDYVIWLENLVLKQPKLIEEKTPHKYIRFIFNKWSSLSCHKGVSNAFRSYKLVDEIVMENVRLYRFVDDDNTLRSFDQECFEITYFD